MPTAPVATPIGQKRGRGQEEQPQVDDLGFFSPGAPRTGNRHNNNKSSNTNMAASSMSLPGNNTGSAFATPAANRIPLSFNADDDTFTATALARMQRRDAPSVRATPNGPGQPQQSAARTLPRRRHLNNQNESAHDEDVLGLLTGHTAARPTHPQDELPLSQEYAEATTVPRHRNRAAPEAATTVRRQAAPVEEDDAASPGPRFPNRAAAPALTPAALDRAQAGAATPAEALVRQWRTEQRTGAVEWGELEERDEYRRDIGMAEVPMTIRQRESLHPARGVRPPSPPPLFALRSQSRPDDAHAEEEQLLGEEEEEKDDQQPRPKRSRTEVADPTIRERRAKVWMATTKAFFDFIDTRPLEVVEPTKSSGTPSKSGNPTQDVTQARMV